MYNVMCMCVTWHTWAYAACMHSSSYCVGIFGRVLPINLFRHFRCRIYESFTHSVTDRQTDRQSDDIMMPTADHTACSKSTIG